MRFCRAMGDARPEWNFNIKVVFPVVLHDQAKTEKIVYHTLEGVIKRRVPPIIG